jgi:predicted TIM-barrel fold metal-dependent hydrolase
MKPRWQAPPEPILDPDLPIIDTHHHFWDRAADRPGHRYLLDELLADLNTGHNIAATVSSNAVRCTAPMALEMRPVGETEFVNGTRDEREGAYGRPGRAGTSAMPI